MDLILGKGHQGVVVTLTERKSRFTLLMKVLSKQAELVAQAIIDLLNWVEHLKTITADNGKEFSNHLHISRHLCIDFFFAHPYASWERGTNENTNGLIRQYLPKSRNLKTLTPQEELVIMIACIYALENALILEPLFSITDQDTNRRPESRLFR